MTLDMADHPGWVGISASSKISEQLTLSAHSALTISVSYEHVWSYDGELNPEVDGGVSHQLMLSGGVTFWYSGSSGYTVMNWKNGAGSSADTVTLRLENPYDQDVGFAFSSNAYVSMTGMDIYTGPELSAPAPVPEPETLGMLLGGLPLVMLALSRRRARQC
ncbi:PEP-CTERM sorting domain-containing protein [Pseudoduganella flava]|uniref:PEP-CTERM sorting domain-containing protein n=2 Tax=Pseudoduganella flava TaxID=871742 RepID=A0ABX6G306_9BURK|nr:PEP-CTERM sorting domain-containing protein [Pseudoduganella flava]